MPAPWSPVAPTGKGATPEELAQRVFLPARWQLRFLPGVDALLGLGNTAFSLQDWQTAETAFRKLADMASDPVPAMNSLALTLEAQGQLAQALEAARRAVSYGGPFTGQSRNTMTTLVDKAKDADDRNR